MRKYLRLQARTWQHVAALGQSWSQRTTRTI